MSKVATSVYRFGPITYDLSARTHIMGILNVTPDSFSDGGQFLDHELAVRRGMAMADEGADIIDIGGESTRPGSEAISGEEELRRVLPVIAQLVKSTSIPVSIDTVKPFVAQRALEAGAVIVNDISGLHGDPAMPAVIAGHGASVVIMHMQGTPKSMQVDPSYDDVVKEISYYLREGITTAQQHGIEQIVVDPGIGFGKTLSHNLEIIRRLREFQPLDYPVMVGPSRKSFIGKVLGLEVDDRIEGTAAAVAASVMNGANLVRVHDVREMKRIIQMTDAIMRG